MGTVRRCRIARRFSAEYYFVALAACQDVGRNSGERFGSNVANTVVILAATLIRYVTLFAGVDAHGGNVQNGCGVRFMWSQAPPYKGDRGERKKQVSWFMHEGTYCSVRWRPFVAIAACFT